jgi:hypothetical protein
MIRVLWILLLAFFLHPVQAQELFVFSEPASNMPSKTIGIRAGSTVMTDKNPVHNTLMCTPEVMYGFSKDFMLHAEGFFTDFNKSFAFNGGALYAKYRFISIDDIHSHLRMSAYTRVALNKNPIHQEAIDLNGYNSGYEVGMVQTILRNRAAISSGVSFLYATDNLDHKFIYGDRRRAAVSYNFSIGKLIIPKEYISYKQLNINGMLEVLGQTNIHTKKNFIDLAPSLQFIIQSKMRIDLGYRFPIINDLSRTMPRNFLIRIEYNFFNAVE